MSRLSKLRTDIQNTNQTKHMIDILENNYPKIIRTVGIFSGILMLPLYLIIWLLMTLWWFIQTVDDGIDWIIDNLEELILLLNSVVTVIVFKIILSRERRKTDE